MRAIVACATLTIAQKAFHCFVIVEPTKPRVIISSVLTTLITTLIVRQLLVGVIPSEIGAIAETPTGVHSPYVIGSGNCFWACLQAPPRTLNSPLHAGSGNLSDQSCCFLSF